MIMFKSLEDLDALLKQHDDYRSRCLNLIASENYASMKVRSYLDNDFGNRYGCYATLNPALREYTGNQYINEFEVQTHELMKEVFHGEYVDLRPIGGHMAGMSVVLALLDPGDLVIEVSLKDWGHGLVGPMCQVSHFNTTIQVEYMSFDADRSVDAVKLEAQIRAHKPKLVIFGGSGTLFPEPVRQFRALADELGFLIAYDASHVTGLIAGGVFPNPLDEGADIMFGSTHKSFPGPQGGFVTSNRRDLMQKVGETLSPSLVTSHHLFRIPALAASLIEMKQYGNAYAKQIVSNSKALAAALEQRGFNVLGKNKGFSESHIILVDAGAQVQEGPAKHLEQSQILCSDDFSGASPEIRIGTSEITRRGMTESDMNQVAELIYRSLILKEAPEVVAGDVERFVKGFQGTAFSL
jgi:glycine hydroxymethyltransferase